VLAAGCGWDHVLKHNRSGTAAWTFRLAATLHGLVGDQRNLGDDTAHLQVSGAAAKLSAAILLSPVKEAIEPWHGEPTDYGGVPFVGLGAGWGRLESTLTDVQGVAHAWGGNGAAGALHCGYRRRTWFFGAEIASWTLDGGWRDPDLSAFRLVAGWRVPRTPVELLGGYGTLNERVAVDMGECAPTRRPLQHAWSLGAGVRLVTQSRWSVRLRVEYTDGIGTWEIDRYDFETTHPEQGKILREARSSLVTAGVTIDWNLLPLRTQ
jgi:hypothetical protein